MDRRLGVMFAVAVAALMLFGCLGFGGKTAIAPMPDGRMGMEDYAPAAQSGSSGTIPSQYLDSSGRMLIKSGSAEVKVSAGTLDARFARLKEIVNASGGYVYGSQYGETESEKYYYITVKIPPSQFESLPAALKELGELKSMSTDTSDVTTEYIDLAVRIDNLKAEKARLLEFYNRSSNVSELLQVEREVTRVQTEIEQLTAQKVQLERRAELGTFTVRLVEEAPMVDRSVLVPLNQLVSIFLMALSLSVTILVGISGFIVPLLVIVLVLYGVWKLVRRGKGGKK